MYLIIVIFVKNPDKDKQKMHHDKEA